MQTVEVSARLDASPSAVKAALSPRAIVEYEGTYEVRTVKECDKVVVEAPDGDFEATLRFTERSDGYKYEQGDHGPFETLETTVTVSEDNRRAGAAAAPDDSEGGERYDGEDAERNLSADAGTARVTMRSQFTFGGWMAPLVDRLAAGTRRDELEHAVANLERDVGGSEAESGPNAAT